MLLNRSRSAAAMPRVGLIAGRRSLTLRFDPDWLAENPLTIADLEREREFLALVGYQLDIS